MKITVLVMALLTLISCSEKDSGEYLSGQALDALDVTIVMLTQRSAMNPITLSANLEKRLSKYENNTKLSISMGGISVKKASEDGSLIIIPPEGKVVCKFDGALKYTIRIIEGEIGIINKEIYVKDNTRAQVDEGLYIFSKGKWKKSK